MTGADWHVRGSEKRVGSECGESEKPELLAEALGGADADVRAAEVELRGAYKHK